MAVDALVLNPEGAVVQKMSCPCPGRRRAEVTSTWRVLRDGGAEAEQGGLLPGRFGRRRAAGEKLHGDRAVAEPVGVKRLCQDCVNRLPCKRIQF